MDILLEIIANGGRLTKFTGRKGSVVGGLPVALENDLEHRVHT